MKGSKLIWTIAGLAVVALIVIATAGWMLLDENESTTSGSCDAALYQLSVEPDDGALEVNFELMSTAPGEVWDVVIEHRDEAVFEGRRTTDEDGELDVDFPIGSSGGDGEYSVTATEEGGQVCTARLDHG